MKPGPYPLAVRAYPTAEGWWWYRIWDGSDWLAPLRRADAMDVLTGAGDTANRATGRLGRARDKYDDFIASGGVVDADDLAGAP